eukprot:g25161.t1
MVGNQKVVLIIACRVQVPCKSVTESVFGLTDVEEATLEATDAVDQDELMQDPSPYTATAAESEKRKRSRRAAWEKKLAILERAIESNPNNVELKVARLELGKESWEPSNLVNEWKKVVFLHPNHTALWQRYLLFCQSQFSIFSTSKVNGIYGKCLSTLAAALDGTLLSHPALPDTEEAML